MQATKTNTNPALTDAVHTLMLARRQSAESKALLAEKRARFEEENADLIALAAGEAAREAEADRNLRALAVAEYQATGDKAPCEGVSIVLAKVLTYDTDVVRGWAEKAMPDLITPPQLNVKAFDKIARTVPLPFVTITETPSARVAAELIADEMERAA
ncbi:MAG: hypothetical protein C0499_02630 [Zymomonas sp.]|nr:hypothetical protein [Zymomonas sp.]